MSGKIRTIFTLVVFFALLLGGVTTGVSNQAMAQQETPNSPGQNGTGTIFLPVVARAMTPGMLSAQQVNVLSLTPESGQPGSQVYIEGSDFNPDMCGVNLYWDSADGSLLGSASLRQGRFALSVLIPEDTVPGDHIILAQVLEFGVEFCGSPSGEQAGAHFTVLPPLPVILLDAVDATPGATITVHGANFCGDPACSTVDILVQGLPGALEVPVNADGTFTADMIIPGGTPLGTNSVSAFQTDAD